MENKNRLQMAFHMHRDKRLSPFLRSLRLVDAVLHEEHINDLPLTSERYPLPSEKQESTSSIGQDAEA